jgi:hypothetical protein
MGTAMVGGMTLRALIDKQAAGRKRRSETMGGMRLWVLAVWRSSERWLWAHAR